METTNADLGANNMFSLLIYQRHNAAASIQVSDDCMGTANADADCDELTSCSFVCAHQKNNPAASNQVSIDCNRQQMPKA